MKRAQYWIFVPAVSILLLSACSSGDSGAPAPETSAPPSPSSVSVSDLMVEWQQQTDQALSRVDALVNKSIDVGVAAPYGLASYPAIAKPLDKASQILADIPESPDNGRASSYLDKASQHLQAAAAQADAGDLVKSSRQSVLATNDLAASGEIVQLEIEGGTD